MLRSRPVLSNLVREMVMIAQSC